METESHAVTHVEKEGAGAICCARGPGLLQVLSLSPARGLRPALSPVSLSYCSCCSLLYPNQ